MSESAGPVYDVILYGHSGRPVMTKGLSSVSIGEATASKGPSLVTSSSRSQSVDHCTVREDTPEAKTVETEDCPATQGAPGGITYTDNVTGASDPRIIGAPKNGSWLVQLKESKFIQSHQRPILIHKVMNENLLETDAHMIVRRG